MSDPASKALKAYEDKHNKRPKDGAALVAFVKGNKELKPITLEQAKAVLSAEENGKQESKVDKSASKKDVKADKSKSKNDETKEKEKQKEKEKEKTPKSEEPPPKPKETVKEKPLYAIGDEVLMSKDRIGIVRYVGEIAELGSGLWYGVELTDGSIGQSDGSVRGKRYFSTEGKRALFVPSSKIRRKMTEKDHKRHDSMRLVQERKADPPSESARESNDHLPRVAEATEESAAETTDSSVARESEKSLPQPQAKTSPVESNTNGSAFAAVPNNYDAKVEESPTSSLNRRPSRSTTLTRSATGVAAAEAYETLLTFILRQSDDMREQLLDVYANPQLHPILVNSYAELKNMEKDEQERVWNALLTRWKRFG